jgi:hypothetical protein
MGFGAAQYDVGRPDAHMQRTAEAAAAYQFNPFADAETQRIEPLMQTLLGSYRAYGCGFSRFQTIQAMGQHEWN